MSEKWYVVWFRFLRQVFCWHKFTFAEPECIHGTCFKCEYHFTNWEAKWEREFNLRAQLQHQYDVLINETTKQSMMYLGSKFINGHEIPLRHIVAKAAVQMYEIYIGKEGHQ